LAASITLKHFLSPSKPGKRPITAAKRKAKEKKERKKNLKVGMPKPVGHFLVQKLSQNFDFCACLSQNVLKRDSSGENG